MRYKRHGWFNDSYRHSLAAKGIRTSFGKKVSKKYIDVTNGVYVDRKIYFVDVETIDTEFQELPLNSSEQVSEVMDVIKRGEEMPPILISPSGHLQDGRHRLEAYKRLGVKKIPVRYGYKGGFINEKKLKEKRSSFLFKVEEDPSYKQLRINRGYKEIVVVDAKKLKERFEKDHKTPLVWRQLRFDLLKDLDKFDKHPELDVLTSGKIDFNDGRHRVAVAASKGETIEVAVRNKQKFIAAGRTTTPF